jgi:tetratricopeptide (TPR) repeat protein
MYKLLLTGSLVLTLTCLQALAQNGVLTNAILYYQDGEFQKAKVEIDAAVQHEKTSTSAKAWYYRGMIYKAIVNQDPSNATSALSDTATVSFLKAKTLDKKGGEYNQMSDLRLQEQYVNTTNEGVKAYQSSNFKKAIGYFQQAHLANPSDTTVLLYGSYAAISDKNQQMACAFCNELKKGGYTKSHAYTTCANYYESINDNAKAEAELKSGLANNPGNVSILQALSNLYISTGQNDKSIETLNALEIAKPNDALVLTNIAVQYQKINQSANAELYYQKALKIDQKNFIALFNLSGLYMEKGRKKMTVYNSLKPEDFQKNGPVLRSEMTSIYGQALDYGTKALALSDNEEDTKKLQLMKIDLESILKTLNK